MPTNLQTEQPTLVLFLPVCHCCAELAAEIQTPVWERGTVTLASIELSRLEGSLPTRLPERGRLCSCAGENTGLSHDIDAL